MSVSPQARLLLQKATRAMRRGQRHVARRLAAEAAALAPEWEDPWLLLAALAPSPRASIGYLERALEINPQSRRARKGMAWAVKRLRERQTATVNVVPPQPKALARWRLGVLPLLIVLMLAFAGWAYAADVPAKVAAQMKPVARPNVVAKPTITPTPTNTPTPTPTFTPSPTPTNTSTPTATPTSTPTPPPTNTPWPTPTPLPPTPQPQVNPFPGLPPGVGPNDKWIDVNLSQQRLYAYVGTQLIRSFVVSTGVAAHPTVTGTYRIYVKYTSTLMTGPGYYLPNVPYTMYFYLGYGIHGTYWHNNFGVPMSHGCINMRTPEAAWLFNWAPLGTVVHIHY